MMVAPGAYGTASPGSTPSCSPRTARPGRRRSHPVLLGTAAVAYTFGLRHAVDADHIAAIDNVTRKLMQDDERPIAVGLFFSLVKVASGVTRGRSATAPSRRT